MQHYKLLRKLNNTDYPVGFIFTTGTKSNHLTVLINNNWKMLDYKAIQELIKDETLEKVEGYEPID